MFKILYPSTIAAIIFFLSNAFLHGIEKTLIIKKQNYKNWKETYFIENEKIKLILLADVGPRIIFFGFKNEENLFHEIEYSAEQLSQDQWRNYGGHRLWIAPENKLITYQTDNKPVKVKIENQKIIMTGNEDSISKTIKEMEIKMHPKFSYVEIIHRIKNNGDAEIELAAWALTVLKFGGTAKIPLGKKGNHPEELLPNYSLALWPYTNLSEPCWKISSDWIEFQSTQKCILPQKIGASGTEGFLTYELRDSMFIKTYLFQNNTVYPDLNSSAEIFSNGKFVELETLSPLRKLKSQETITHTEYWTIQNTEAKEMNFEEIKKLKQHMLESFKK